MRSAGLVLLGLVSAATPATAQAPPVKIGVLMELSGAFGTTGQLVRHGIEFYLKQKGDVLGGRNVAPIFEDTAGDPATAINKVKKLVESDKIEVLMGPINSATGAAVKNYVVEQKIPDLIMSTVNEVVNGKYMFRTSFDADSDGYLQGYLPAKVGLRKGVVLAPNYLAGQTAAEFMARGFAAMGGAMIQRLLPRVGAPDYGSFIAQIAPEADAAFIFFTGIDAVRFMKQWDDYGMKLPRYGAVSAVDETLLPAEGKTALGFIGATTYVSTIDTPENRAFLKDWTEAYPAEKPGWLTLSGWIAAAVLDHAIAAVNGNLADKEAFLEAIKDTRIMTPAGPFRFDDGNNPVLPRVIIQIREVGGVIEPVVVGTIPEFVPVLAPPTLPAGVVLPR